MHYLHPIYINVYLLCTPLTARVDIDHQSLSG